MEERVKTPEHAELELLVQAAKQYETYKQINSFSLLAEEKQNQAVPYADWAHPIGLVMTGSR